MAFYDSALAAYDRFSQAIDSARLAEEKFEWQKSKDIETAGLAREKFAFEQFKVQRQEQIESAKFTINKWTEQANSIESPTLRKHAVETMRQYHGSLPPWLAAAMEPLIKRGPIGAQAEKEQQFREYYPEPRRPGQEIKTTTKDGATSMEQAMGDPRKYAEDYFTHKDWEMKRDNVVHGRKITERESFLSFGDAGAAIRNEKGMITILNGEQLGLKKIEDFYGSNIASPATVMANGGAVFPGGSDYVTIQGNSKITVRNGINVVDPTKRVNPRIVGREAAPEGIRMAEQSAAASKFKLDYVGQNKDNPATIRIRELIEKGKGGIAAAKIQLDSMFPGTTWDILGIENIPDELLGFISFGTTDDHVLISHPKLVETFVDATGNEHRFYLDSNRRVSNLFGQDMGDIEDVQKRLLGHEVKPPPKTKARTEIGSKFQASKIPAKFKGKVEKTLTDNMNLFLKIGLGFPSLEERDEAQAAVIDFTRAIGLGEENWKEAGRLAKNMGGFVWEWYNTMLSAIYRGAGASATNLFNVEK